MKHVVETFLTALGANGVTPANTVAAYRTDLTQFVHFLEAHGVGDVAALRHEEMDAFCAWLQANGYAPATVARRIAALRAFGTYLVQAGLLVVNPADGLTRPRLAKRAEMRLSAEQLQALRAATLQEMTPEGWRDRALLEVLTATGLRASELVGLNVADLALEASSLTVQDGSGARRSVALTAEAVMALATYLQLGRPHLIRRDSRELALLLNVRGQRLTRQGCWEILQKYARQLQFEGVSLELLRQLASQDTTPVRSV